MIKAGVAHYHIKPIMPIGLIIGGIIFGISMAILGKCPGTGPISIADGRVDVLVGAVGGLFGGAIFTIYHDDIFKPMMDDTLGRLTLLDFFKGSEDIVILIFGIVVTIIAIAIPKRELLDEADLAKLKG